MKKSFIVTLVCGVLCVVSSGIMLVKLLQYKNTIDTYKNYVIHCEHLIDYIAYSQDTFCDTIGETDAYQEYLDSKELVELLNNK